MANENQNDRDKLEELWLSLGGKLDGFTVSLERFRADMADERMRTELHGNLPNYFPGFNIDYETFSSDMGFKKKVEEEVIGEDLLPEQKPEEDEESPSPPSTIEDEQVPEPVVEKAPDEVVEPPDTRISDMITAAKLSYEQEAKAKDLPTGLTGDNRIISDEQSARIKKAFEVDTSFAGRMMPKSVSDYKNLIVRSDAYYEGIAKESLDKWLKGPTPTVLYKNERWSKEKNRGMWKKGATETTLALHPELEKKDVKRYFISEEIPELETNMTNMLLSHPGMTDSFVLSTEKEAEEFKKRYREQGFYDEAVDIAYNNVYQRQYKDVVIKGGYNDWLERKKKEFPQASEEEVYKTMALEAYTAGKRFFSVEDHQVAEDIKKIEEKQKTLNEVQLKGVTEENYNEYQSLLHDVQKLQEGIATIKGEDRKEVYDYVTGERITDPNLIAEHEEQIKEKMEEILATINAVPGSANFRNELKTMWIESFGAVDYLKKKHGEVISTKETSQATPGAGPATWFMTRAAGELPGGFRKEEKHYRDLTRNAMLEFDALSRFYLLNESPANIDKNWSYYKQTIGNDIMRWVPLTDEAYINLPSTERNFLDAIQMASEREGIGFSDEEKAMFERTLTEHTVEFGIGLVPIMIQLGLLNKVAGLSGATKFIQALSKGSKIQKMVGFLGGLALEEVKLQAAGFPKGEGVGFGLAHKIPMLNLPGKWGTYAAPFVRSIWLGSIGATMGLEMAKASSITFDAFMNDKDWTYRMDQYFGDMDENQKRWISALIVNQSIGTMNYRFLNSAFVFGDPKDIMIMAEKAIRRGDFDLAKDYVFKAKQIDYARDKKTFETFMKERGVMEQKLKDNKEKPEQVEDINKWLEERAPNVLVRTSDLSPDGTSFAGMEGKNKYMDPRMIEKGGNVVYDVSDVVIADIYNKETRDKIIDKAIKFGEDQLSKIPIKSVTKERARIEKGLETLKTIKEKGLVADFMDANLENLIVDAAKSLQFDGIHVWDVKHPDTPTERLIWNIKNVKQIKVELKKGGKDAVPKEKPQAPEKGVETKPKEKPKEEVKKEPELEKEVKKPAPEKPVEKPKEELPPEKKPTEKGPTEKPTKEPEVRVEKEVKKKTEKPATPAEKITHDEIVERELKKEVPKEKEKIDEDIFDYERNLMSKELPDIKALEEIDIKDITDPDSKHYNEDIAKAEERIEELNALIPRLKTGSTADKHNAGIAEKELKSLSEKVINYQGRYTKGAELVYRKLWDEFKSRVKGEDKTITDKEIEANAEAWKDYLFGDEQGISPATGEENSWKGHDFEAIINKAAIEFAGIDLKKTRTKIREEAIRVAEKEVSETEGAIKAKKLTLKELDALHEAQDVADELEKVSKDYYIYTKVDGEVQFKKTENAKPYKSKERPDLDLFVYKKDNKSWQVVDAVTGLSFESEYHKTRKEAIAAVEAVIKKHGKDRVDMILYSNIYRRSKENPDLSPRYKLKRDLGVILGIRKEGETEGLASIERLPTKEKAAATTINQKYQAQKKIDEGLGQIMEVMERKLTKKLVPDQPRDEKELKAFMEGSKKVIEGFIEKGYYNIVEMVNTMRQSLSEKQMKELLPHLQEAYRDLYMFGELKDELLVNMKTPDSFDRLTEGHISKLYKESKTGELEFSTGEGLSQKDVLREVEVPKEARAKENTRFKVGANQIIDAVSNDFIDTKKLIPENKKSLDNLLSDAKNDLKDMEFKQDVGPDVEADPYIGRKNEVLNKQIKAAETLADLRNVLETNMERFDRPSIDKAVKTQKRMVDLMEAIRQESPKAISKENQKKLTYEYIDETSSTEQHFANPEKIMPKEPRISVDPISEKFTEGPLGLEELLSKVSKRMGKRMHISKPGKRRKAAGVYDSQWQSIKMKRANRIDVVAHELGHFVDDVFGVMSEWKDEMTSPYDNELKPFWVHGSKPPAYMKTKVEKRRYIRAEGVAEWIRAYIVNPVEAKKAAPEFYKNFTKKVSTDYLEAIHEYSNLYRSWAGQSATDMTMGQVAKKANIKRLAGFEFKNWKVKRDYNDPFSFTVWDKMREIMSDDKRFAKIALEFAKNVNPQKSLPEDDALILMSVFSDVGGLVERMFKFGLMDTKKKRRTDSETGEEMPLHYLVKKLRNDSYKELEREMQLTMAYMISQRTLFDLHENIPDAKVLTGVGGGVFTDISIAEATLKEINDLKTTDPAKFGRIEETARRYREWAIYNLQYMVDGGRMSQDLFDKIETNNDYYVAMARVMNSSPTEEIIMYSRGGGGALGYVKEVIHPIKGSSRTMINPYESLMQATYNSVHETDRNAVVRAYVDAFDLKRKQYDPVDVMPGLDQLVTKIDPSKVTKQQLEKSLLVYRDGKKEYYKIHEIIDVALNELGTEKLMPWAAEALIKTFSFWPQVMRNSVIKSPIFPIINTNRDIFHRLIVSATNKGGITGLRDMLEGEVGVRELRDYGGDMAGFYMKNQYDYNALLERVMKDEISKGKNIILDPMKMARALKKGYMSYVESGETLNRVAEFRSAYRHAKYKLGYNEHNAKLYAARRARELIDFAVAGTLMRQINRIFVFSNPAIQGLKSAVRSARKDPAKFSLNFTKFVVMPTAMEYAMALAGGYNDERRQLPSYLKDLYWNFKIGPDQWVRIPKPFELGVASSIVNRSLDAIIPMKIVNPRTGAVKYVRDKHAFDGYLMSVVTAFQPFSKQNIFSAPIPLVPLGIGEAYTNMDVFRGTTVVPAEERHLGYDYLYNDYTKERYDKYASNLGKGIGSIIRVDARQVDHVIGKQFTYFGQYAMRASDMDVDLTILSYIRNSPVYAARDVQWVMNKAEKIGLINRSGRTSNAEYKYLLNSLYYYYRAEEDIRKANPKKSGRELKKLIKEERDSRGTDVRNIATDIMTHWEKTGLPRKKLKHYK